MPILSMFYGIVAYMYFYDTQKHHLPHFHVEYAEHSAVVAIATGDVLEGSLPQNKMKLVQAWLESIAMKSWPIGAWPFGEFQLKK